MKNLLVAIRPDDLETMRSALADEFRLTFCHSLHVARGHLAGPLDAVVCGLHFDDGNMFELLQQLRSDERTRALPFLCIKGAGNTLSPSILKSIVIASQKMGANDFIDLADLQAKHGAEQAFSLLRAGLRRLLDAVS